VSITIKPQVFCELVKAFWDLPDRSTTQTK